MKTERPRADRPLSPHLQIYKPQLTSVLSITHRGSGVLLALGSLALGMTLVALALGIQTFSTVQEQLRSWYGQCALLTWSACLYYHLCNGVRHLFWDAGYGFQLKTAYASGIAVLALTAALTALTWVLSAYRLSGGP